MTPSARDLALRERRDAARQRREMADLNRPLVVPLVPRLTGAPPGPPHAPGEASETCPDCHGPIGEGQEWCPACGSSRGVATSTPREDYLRACVSALELVRQTSRRVRPLPETREAERLLEVAIGRLREGVEL